jgi:hypothetical protein
MQFISIIAGPRGGTASILNIFCKCMHRELRDATASTYKVTLYSEQASILDLLSTSAGVFGGGRILYCGPAVLVSVLLALPDQPA